MGGLEALEHVGKTISYSQMLSGHYSSYAWTPRGDDPNTQLRKALELRIRSVARTSGLQGIFDRRVKWVLVRLTMGVSENA